MCLKILKLQESNGSICKSFYRLEIGSSSWCVKLPECQLINWFILSMYQGKATDWKTTIFGDKCSFSRKIYCKVITENMSEPCCFYTSFGWKINGFHMSTLSQFQVSAMFVWLEFISLNIKYTDHKKDRKICFPWYHQCQKSKMIWLHYDNTALEFLWFVVGVIIQT